jgi:hypothetical protein
MNRCWALELVQGSSAKFAVFRFRDRAHLPSTVPVNDLRNSYVTYPGLRARNGNGELIYAVYHCFRISLLPSEKTLCARATSCFMDVFRVHRSNFLQHFKCKAHCLCIHFPNRLRHDILLFSRRTVKSLDQKVFVDYTAGRAFGDCRQ